MSDSRAGHPRLYHFVTHSPAMVRLVHAPWVKWAGVHAAALASRMNVEGNRRLQSLARGLGLATRADIYEVRRALRELEDAATEEEGG